MTSIIDAALTYNNQEYRDFKIAVSNEASQIKRKGITALVAGVALLVLGTLLCLLTGPVGKTFGAIAITASLPLLYFGYNNTVLGNNIKELVADLVKTAIMASDKQLFKQNLAKGTFCFDWVIDPRIDALYSQLKLN